MTGAAFDANVLIYAVAPLDRVDGEAHREMVCDARALVMMTSEFWISPGVEMELRPGLSEAEAAAMRLSDARTLRADGAVVHEASRILEAARKVPNRCAICAVPSDATKCSTCGRTTRGTDVVTDAMLLAAASLESRVGTLYSYDGGLIALAQFARAGTIIVRRPPKAGGDLAELAERKAHEDASATAASDEQGE